LNLNFDICFTVFLFKIASCCPVFCYFVKINPISGCKCKNFFANKKHICKKILIFITILKTETENKESVFGAGVNYYLSESGEGKVGDLNFFRGFQSGVDDRESVGAVKTGFPRGKTYRSIERNAANGEGIGYFEIG